MTQWPLLIGGSYLFSYPFTMGVGTNYSVSSSYTQLSLDYTATTPTFYDPGSAISHTSPYPFVAIRSAPFNFTLSLNVTVSGAAGYINLAGLVYNLTTSANAGSILLDEVTNGTSTISGGVTINVVPGDSYTIYVGCPDLYAATATVNANNAGSYLSGTY